MDSTHGSVFIDDGNATVLYWDTQNTIISATQEQKQSNHTTKSNLQPKSLNMTPQWQLTALSQFSNWSCAPATWPFGQMVVSWESRVRSPPRPSTPCHNSTASGVYNLQFFWWKYSIHSWTIAEHHCKISKQLVHELNTTTGATDKILNSWWHSILIHQDPNGCHSKHPTSLKLDRTLK